MESTGIGLYSSASRSLRKGFSGSCSDKLPFMHRFAYVLNFPLLGLRERSATQALTSDHKYLRICDLCKELGIVVCARILQRSGSGKLRPTLVWCLCAR